MALVEGTSKGREVEIGRETTTMNGTGTKGSGGYHGGGVEGDIIEAGTGVLWGLVGCVFSFACSSPSPPLAR
jgi:hypothetical protein